MLDPQAQIDHKMITKTTPTSHHLSSPREPTIATDPTPPQPYTHPEITAMTLNTKGMHTTIIDLQALLKAHPTPHILDDPH